MAVHFDPHKDFRGTSIEVISPLQDYNPFPSWCVLDPKITEEHSRILTESWFKLISGDSQGFRQYKLLDVNTTRRISFGKYPPTSRSTIVPPSSTPTFVGMHATDLDSLKEEEIESKIRSGVILSQKRRTYLSAPSETETLDPKRSVSSSSSNSSVSSSDAQERPKTPQTAKTTPAGQINAEAFQFFYDTFFERLFHINLSLDLRLGANIQSRMDFIKTLCQFLVTAAKTAAPESLVISVKDIIAKHATHNITALDYDAIGQALLLTLKHCLGNDFTAEVKESWRLLYSQFLTTGLPYVDGPKTVYIKKRTVPELSMLFSPLGSPVESSVLPAPSPVSVRLSSAQENPTERSDRVDSLHGSLTSKHESTPPVTPVTAITTTFPTAHRTSISFSPARSHSPAILFHYNNGPASLPNTPTASTGTTQAATTTVTTGVIITQKKKKRWFGCCSH